MNRSRPRMALLAASYEKENTRRNFRREIDADLVEFDCTAGEIPCSFEYDAVVVTGSRASVYWDEDWIDGVREYVREAVDAGLPALGICWGHQLIADALGGEVAAMGEDVYEIGYREIERLEGDSEASTDASDNRTQSGDDRGLFDGIDDRFTAFTTHGDEVVELPPGAVPLAENDYSNHAFRVDHAFGVQFHPEYDRRTAREVTEGKDHLDEQRRQSVLEGIDAENYAAACEAKQVFDNFVAYVQRHRARTAAD